MVLHYINSRIDNPDEKTTENTTEKLTPKEILRCFVLGCSNVSMVQWRRTYSVAQDQLDAEDSREPQKDF
jgi:hypothetical protein